MPLEGNQPRNLRDFDGTHFFLVPEFRFETPASGDSIVGSPHARYLQQDTWAWAVIYPFAPALPKAVSLLCFSEVNVILVTTYRDRGCVTKCSHNHQVP